jgi:hypothetical protein
MMEIHGKIHVVKMRTQVLEIIISFMIPYSLTHLSRLLDNTHFIVCRNKTKTHWKKNYRTRNLLWTLKPWGHFTWTRQSTVRKFKSNKHSDKQFSRTNYYKRKNFSVTQCYHKNCFQPDRYNTSLHNPVGCVLYFMLLIDDEIDEWTGDCFNSSDGVVLSQDVSEPSTQS